MNHAQPSETVLDPLGAQLHLREDALEPLPLGSILPEGWLHTQLVAQANGLTGSLDEFWPDVANSAWIGGDGDGWERGPYWLDGAIPLAFLTGDESLRRKVDNWVTAILKNQTEDGWLGPPATPLPDSGWMGTTKLRHDIWPRTIVVKALIQYHEATGHAGIIPALTRFYRNVECLVENGLILREWARFRWPDFVLGIHWLYRQTGGSWLVQLATDIQQLGFDWRHHFQQFPYDSRVSPIECDLSSHGPNHAMGIKYGPVAYRHTHTTDTELISEALDVLDQLHGQANGMFSCDEHLAGRHPSQGTELCAVTEMMFSLEVAIGITGNLQLADLLERITFNALPATISADMWTHQYLQQVNQIRSVIAEKPVYTSNRGDANVFGLEPHFGCCTANMHQGWPKFTSHLWMKTPRGNLTAVSYAPCRVTTNLDGHPVSVQVSGDYPFSDAFMIEVTNERAHQFELELRVPEWCHAPEIVANGTSVSINTDCHLAHVPISATHMTVNVKFPRNPRIERRSESSASAYLGPLLLALPLEETWTTLVERPEVSDYQVTTDSPWEYALDVDTVDEWQVTMHPADSDAPAFAATPRLECTVRGTDITWDEHRDVAVHPPKVIMDSTQTLRDLRLIPYGNARLRIAEFPILARTTDEEDK